jgi:hypothetical protein
MTITALRRSISFRNVIARVGLLISAARETTGTTASAPISGTRISGISSPVP